MKVNEPAYDKQLKTSRVLILILKSSSINANLTKYNLLNRTLL